MHQESVFLSFIVASLFAVSLTGQTAMAATLKTEIQMDICDASLSQTLRRLDLDKSEGESRRTYLFDTRDDGLSSEGVVLRLRRESEEDTFTIKWRHADMRRLTERLKNDDDFKCETDEHIGEDPYTTCSLEKEPDSGDVEAVLGGDESVYSLFTDKQKHFVEVIGLDKTELRAAKKQPVMHQRVWKFSVEQLSDDMALEYTKQSGEERIELSLRVPQSRAKSAKRKALALLEENGLSICE